MNNGKYKKHIHTHIIITINAINNLGPNSILLDSKYPSPFMTQTNYSSGLIVFTLHASAVDTTHNSYKANTDSMTPPTTLATSARPPHTHTTKHITEDCAILTPLRKEHIIDVRDFWVAPGRSIGYLHATGLFKQN